MTSASVSRVTRSSRSLRLAILLFAGVLAAATVLRAQETPPAAPAPAPATPAESPPGAAASGDEASGEAPGEPRSGEVATDETRDEAAAPGEPPAETNPPAPADRTRPVGPTPGRFEPTEKVRADFDVAFPIDI